MLNYDPLSMRGSSPFGGVTRIPARAAHESRRECDGRGKVSTFLAVSALARALFRG